MKPQTQGLEVKYLVATGGSLKGAHPDIGVMKGPRQTGDRALREGRVFAIDNDCFNDRYGDDAFEKHLERLREHSRTCLFVAVPDVVDDPDATSTYFWSCARELGEWPFRLAYVAQTGCTSDHVPWGCISTLFLAGNDKWREGPDGTALIKEAKEEGLWVHVGRVNSKKRLLHYERLGVDSVDGTHLSYAGREQGLQNVTRWLQEAMAYRDTWERDQASRALLAQRCPETWGSSFPCIDAAS